MSDLPIHPDDDPLNKRRAKPVEGDKRDVTFSERKLSPERLAALREFLKHATADEIASVRRQFGDNLDVLQSIGLEVKGHSGDDIR
jgi:hypothetical protein